MVYVNGRERFKMGIPPLKSKFLPFRIYIKETSCRKKQHEEKGLRSIESECGKKTLGSLNLKPGVMPAKTDPGRTKNQPQACHSGKLSHLPSSHVSQKRALISLELSLLLTHFAE